MYRACVRACTPLMCRSAKHKCGGGYVGTRLCFVGSLTRRCFISVGSIMHIFCRESGSVSHHFSRALRTISLRTRRRRRARRAGLSPRGTARICRRARLPTTTCRAADCRAGVAKALAVWSRGECQTCIAACTSFRLNSGCWRVGTPPPPLAPRGVHPCGYRGESLPSRTAPPCSHPGSGHLSEIHVPGLPESGDNARGDP